MGKHISDMTLDELKAELTRLYGEETIDADKVNEVKKLIAQKEVTKGQLETEIKELQRDQQQAENEGRLDLHAEVTRNLKAKEAQLAELRQSEQFEAQEQRVEEGKTQISTAIDELGIEDPNVKELIIIITEDNMRSLQEEHAQVVGELNVSHRNEVEAKQATISAKDIDIEDLEEEVKYIRELKDDLEQALREEKDGHQKALDMLNETTNRLNEVEQNRKNAVIQLEEVQAENERLKSHIEDLQQDLANAPSPKPAIDITPTKEKSDLVEAINKKYTSAVPLNAAGLYYDVKDEDGNTQVMPRKEVEQLKEKGLVMPELGASFRVHDENSQENPTADEKRIITVDEEAEISEGEQGSNFPSIESQGPDQVGSSDTGTHEVDKKITRQEFELLRTDVETIKRRIGMEVA